MKKGLTAMLCMFFVVGFVVVSAQYSSAETINNAVPLAVQDNTGENVGPVDLLAAQAEIYQRKVVGGPSTEALLKLTLKTTPNLPGVVIFESDLDNSTGTGGTFGTIGAPVPPCDSCGCKCTAGLDIAVTIYHRTQGDTSGSAFCGGCVEVGDCTTSCQVERKGGEWYAVTAIDGQPLKALGFLRGYSDPTPGVIAGNPVQTSYSLPWRDIVVWANARLAGQAGKFNMTKAQAKECSLTATPCASDGDCTVDPQDVCNATFKDNKWQASIFYDANWVADEDDVTSGTFPAQTFDICDWVPDGDETRADVLASDDLTYCEGNFDQDSDVDGGDAAAFKANFGRSGFKNPCPDANAWY